MTNLQPPTDPTGRQAYDEYLDALSSRSYLRFVASDLDFRGASFEGLEAPRSEVYNCRLDGVSFAGARLSDSFFYWLSR